MNFVTVNLENDHTHILILTDIMEKITQKPDANIAHLETIAEIINNFVDGFHHTKEEDLLFPKMVEKGFSFQKGTIAFMIHDHVLGQNFLKNISDNISLYKEGNKAVLADIYTNMQRFIELLRAHIEKENIVIFRMVDNTLSGEEQHNLIEKFKMVESNPIGGRYISDYIILIEQLAKTYNIL